MGLEKHVNLVLMDSGLVEHLWFWNVGLFVPDPEDAEVIMRVLDGSGEFGPTRYNKITKEIEFAYHKKFCKGGFVKGWLDWDQFVKDYKAFKVNRYAALK